MVRKAEAERERLRRVISAEGSCRPRHKSPRRTRVMADTPADTADALLETVVRGGAEKRTRRWCCVPGGAVRFLNGRQGNRR